MCLPDMPSDDSAVPLASFTGPDWARPENQPRYRPAEIGDSGFVIGALSHTGSGLMQLALKINEGEVALLSGDFRAIQQIVDDLAFAEVEVIESEASTPWGFHDVRPIQEAEESSQPVAADEMNENKGED